MKQWAQPQLMELNVSETACDWFPWFPWHPGGGGHHPGGGGHHPGGGCEPPSPTEEPEEFLS